jgi:predicted GNAT family acetyltransferase
LSEDKMLAAWLDQMLQIEPDLRPSLGVAKEAKRGARVPQIILLEDGLPAAYAEVSRVGRAIEVATGVVDPAHRGKGLSHQLVQQGWERWRQDPMLHRAPLGGEVNLAAATRGEDAQSLVRGPLISITRDAAMAAALVGGGFTLLPRKRRPSRLWLFKSDMAALPIGIQLALAINRLLRGIRIIFTCPRRIIHHLRHARDYRLFVRIPETADVPPPRSHSRIDSENEGVAQDVMDQMEAVAFTMVEPPVDPASVTALDEGE